MNPELSTRSDPNPELLIITSKRHESRFQNHLLGPTLTRSGVARALSMCWRRGSLLENAGFTRLLVFFCTFESLSIYQSKYLQQITMHSFRFFSSSATPATISALFKKSTINHLSSRKRNIFWRCNRLRCHINVLESSRHKNVGSYHLKSHRLRGENWKSRGADGF